MGPMLLLVLGILSAVGLGLYQFGEHHRFDMVSDAKGGIFIIDRKSAAINYCNDKTCSLVGNGALPSQIMGNPAAMASMQGAIMGAPAAVVAPQAGQAPNGMNANIASSGVANAAQADVAAATHDGDDVQNADDEPHPDAGAPDAESHPDAGAPDAESHPDDQPDAAAPEGFSFN
jgi:hypothetical protein